MVSQIDIILIELKNGDEIEIPLSTSEYLYKINKSSDEYKIAIQDGFTDDDLYHILEQELKGHAEHLEYVESIERIR